MRRILLGLLWLVVILIILYLGGGILFVQLHGGPRAFQSSLAAGQTFREQYLVYILIIGLIVAAGGTLWGLLPGTKSKRASK